MKRHRIHIANQDGSMLVIAMLILVLLTLLGVSASTTTEVELKIADNDRSHKINVFRAESGAMLAAQQMENETNMTNLINLHQLASTGTNFLDSPTRHPKPNHLGPSQQHLSTGHGWQQPVFGGLSWGCQRLIPGHERKHPS